MIYSHWVVEHWCPNEFEIDRREKRKKRRRGWWYRIGVACRQGGPWRETTPWWSGRGANLQFHAASTEKGVATLSLSHGVALARLCDIVEQTLALTPIQLLLHSLSHSSLSLSLSLSLSFSPSVEHTRPMTDFFTHKNEKHLWIEKIKKTT